MQAPNTLMLIYALAQSEVVILHLLQQNKIGAVEFTVADPRFLFVPVNICISVKAATRSHRFLYVIHLTANIFMKETNKPPQNPLGGFQRSPSQPQLLTRQDTHDSRRLSEGPT